ncbi:hypothetical protein [Devosia marina]|uniref:Uncharacterized protein n=1 Tax=Devosia marina TaxID=2683198 RepID=A0A7X3FQ83_9HYPH|nr:hypothetical protein [Devosia marina]MVS97890.1 hypothetical protein [Devosia marina]
MYIGKEEQDAIHSPSSNGAMGRDDMIGFLAHELQHAGPDQDNIAFRLDNALALLERNALGRTAQQLNTDEYRVLSSALSTASARAYANPPAGLSNAQVMSGLLLVSQLLIFWALPDETRAASSTMAGRLRDLARVLRNHMHNANLLNRVQEGLAADMMTDAPPVKSRGLPVDSTAAMKLFIRSMTAPGHVDAA